MNKDFFLLIQIILGIALAGLILLQAKGAGLSGGPFGNVFAAYSTKRGVEKVIFELTIALAILFFLSSAVQLILG